MITLESPYKAASLEIISTELREEWVSFEDVSFVLSFVLKEHEFRKGV
jgi:hypothetical protein